MTKDTITAKVEEFRKLVYEPEHEETTCWCKPDFIKREDGKLEIKHHEQRDVLADFLRESLTEIATLARKEGREEAVEIVKHLELKAPTMHPDDKVVQFSRDLLEHAKSVFTEALTN